VRKYLRRYDPVIVHSTGLEADLIARWAARELSTAAVDSITCVDWPRSGSTALTRSISRYLDVSTIEDADAIVTDCATFATKLEGLGVPAERILFDPPSIDVAEVLAQADEPWRPPARPLGPLVGYGGRIQASRGLGTLVAASAILDARGALAEVVIAGDGPLLRELREDARSSRVRYLGYVDSVPAVLKQLQIAVFPSVEPGVPTSLLEAAALGRPIVASRVEGISELFADDYEIKLVPPGDAKALAVQIAELLEDPEEAAALGQRARKRTIDEYSSAASIDRHMSLYRRFMAV
jgi:glycosyltransferase involved in cell wall biosynthesis